MYEFKPETSEFKGVTFFVLFLWIKLCLLQAHNHWTEENFNLSHQATRRHSILYHANLSDIRSARKLDKKQLLLPMVTAGLIFLGLCHMSHRWTFADALWLNHRHSRWTLRDLPSWQLAPFLTPFPEVLCATGLCHSISHPRTGGMDPPNRPQVSLLLLLPLKALWHFWDKPYNSPQWAILGWKWAKVTLTQAIPLFFLNSFLYLTSLCFT